MKVYVVLSCTTYRQQNSYGDYGNYYQETTEIESIFAKEEDAEKYMNTKEQEYQNTNIDIEFWVERWLVE